MGAGPFLEVHVHVTSTQAGGATSRPHPTATPMLDWPPAILQQSDLCGACSKGIVVLAAANTQGSAPANATCC
eukprot:5758638-Alexandrium_andersonii.AAC.1